ncbi:MAG: hypothetical protein BWY75_03228 [bacterium ADurb.Bin425]|uniref:ATP-binding protein n=1 Tax=Candidatus Obscuribacter phosphatis TaxID=1906157 RepID=A0A8J7PEP2_9BACT|nr:ATP-binding protein [Candidatus Obscuribacter phosphatis]OPZ82893.1 MAG: hypothetical protein BWY75_03228 [bacterium ADurb.Bin425]
MKIIVTGASGVGKTTLVEALAPLLSLPVIPETARELCRQWGAAYPGEIPLEKQEEFKFAVLEKQIEKENSEPSYLSDRSAVDAWVLWQRWNICQAMSYDTEKFYALAKAQAQTYTHVIYIPPLFEPVDDGFRWTDLDYQKQIDRLTRMTLYDFGLLQKTYTVKSAPMQERLEEVRNWLGKENHRG